MRTITLAKTVHVLLFLFLVFGALYFARAFFIPFTIAGILSMLFLPLSKKLELKGINKAVSAIICILILILFFAGVITLVIWQVQDLAKDKEKLQQQLSYKVEQLKQTIDKKLGISPEKQEEILKEQQHTLKGGTAQAGGNVLSSVFGFIVDTVLVIVYIFFLMYSRHRIKTFILRLVPENEKQHTAKVITDITHVAHQYLTGLFMMIIGLWIMYGIGFSLIGVKNALFFAILCGLLEIVPFVGNITGTSITVLMAISQGASGGMIIGIVVIYAIVQFIQGNILEPFLVGKEVNISPLATIIVLVIGALLWGIAGMLLAIPLLGITKIVCENVEGLKPYAYLIGDEKKEKKGAIMKKIKGWFK